MTAGAVGSRSRSAEIARLRAAFDRLACVDCPPRSPLYARICAAVAGDDEVLATMLVAPVAQRRPMLLLAAIHDVLLAGTVHPLAAHVPTLAGDGVAVGDPGELALDLCRLHRDVIAEILATRSTQTNEVNRTCALRAALAVTTPPGQPLRLVELGASAGLNLLLDRYAYRYELAPASASDDRAAAGTATVQCACVVEGARPSPIPAPVIAERVGVDLDPIDVRDERAVRAGCWPASGPTRPTASPACGPRSSSPATPRRACCAATAWSCSASSPARPPGRTS